jgi:predicted RNA binding protein YcfA (HicA-like mRNA interferase family)
MNKLPSISAEQMIRVLKKAGFGSHIVMVKAFPKYCEVVVPNHKTLKIGLAHALIKQAGLKKKEFKDLL